MGGLKINFAEVESGFEPLPEGRYECVIDRIEVRESQSSDNDYLNWTLKVLDEEHEGRLLWLMTSLSPRALFRLKDIFQELDVLGEDEEVEIAWDDEVDITPREGPQVTDPDLEGTAVIAVVENEMYDGRERNRVQQLLASNGGGTKRASPAKKSTAKKSTAKSGGRSRKLR